MVFSIDFFHPGLILCELLQFDMVCEDRWIQATSKSVFMAGLMIGVIIFGSLSDQ